MKAYERFLSYVKINTTSNDKSTDCPSTPRQSELALTLVKEMQDIGIADAQMDAHGYVYGTLDANCDEDAPTIGLIAHMDTSNAASGENIRPNIIRKYDGHDITLNPDKGIVMRTGDYKSLLDYVDDDLIVTDGTTLLGTDDKAGIAEILTAIETLQKNGNKHGIIKIAFTPDEEIGRGADRFDVNAFGANFAYTVDGGMLGEIEYENFNAASADVIVHGVSIHPGDAKGRMKNTILIGMAFNAMLPANEIPACTEGYEGFYHLSNLAGTEERAELHYIIRDHDKNKFEAKHRLGRV